MGPWTVSLDHGWHHTWDAEGQDIWYKGYLDQWHLADKVQEIVACVHNHHTGNYCVIHMCGHSVMIRHNPIRTFPLWYNEDAITNLCELEHMVGADCTCQVDPDMQVTTQLAHALADQPHTELTFAEVCDRVHAILDVKVATFLQHNPLPLKMFLTGGVDTALLYAYVKAHTDSYDLVNCLHWDLDEFVCDNIGKLAKYWAYTQIHHWCEPTVLVSGAWGDELGCRSTGANMLLQHHGHDIRDLLQQPQYADAYQRDFYAMPNKQKDLAQLPNGSGLSFTACMQKMLSIHINDHQHWHLGHTLTWTPLHDVEIFQTIANLCATDLCDQIMRASVQHELIRRLDPSVLTHVFAQKSSYRLLHNPAVTQIA